MTFAARTTHQNDLSPPELIVGRLRPSAAKCCRAKVKVFVKDITRTTRRNGRCSELEFNMTVERVVAALPPLDRIIVGAALRMSDGAVCRLASPGGHADLIAALRCSIWTHMLDGAEEGFITSHEEFVDRAEGFRIAFRAGQRMKPSANGVQTLLLADID